MVRPRVIMLENVEEFKTWGPLNRRHRPIKKKQGSTFKKFVEQLEDIGYHVEFRELVAADYGAPTKRKRFFLIARCDGKPIIWPEPTHAQRDSKEVAEGRMKAYIPAADIIDWSIPCPSIFERKKPLAENTLKRIAKGLQKFVMYNPEPFIIQVNHAGDNFRGQSIHDPMPTITQKHGFGVISPYIMQIGQTGFTSDRNRSLAEPLSTIVTKNEHCLIAPYMIQYHSETTKTGVRGQQIADPIQTIDTSNRYGLVMAFLKKFYKTGTGQGLAEPIHTITTSPGHFGQVSVLAVDWKWLMTAGADEETARKATWVSEFIMEYYGSGTGQSLNDPLHTIVTKDRFALITILGNEYIILDIFLRMLTPEELKLAQGFPRDYIIDRDYNWQKYPVCEQVERIGNSVVPIMAKTLVEINCPYLKVGEREPFPSVYTQQSGQIAFG